MWNIRVEKNITPKLRKSLFEKLWAELSRNKQKKKNLWTVVPVFFEHEQVVIYEIQKNYSSFHTRGKEL